MKLKKFSPAIISKIEDALNQELKTNASPVAAFDADGTLWDTDMGEGFFQYEITQKLLPLPENPWRHYRDWKESGDPRPAYLWLAQIHKGLPLSQVREWAHGFFKSIDPAPIFEEQRSLIEYLQKQKVKIYVVTASITWSVEPGAAMFGVPAENVVGVQTKVEKGLITDLQDGEITYREGKRQQLLAATKGIAPFLSCGNTTGDLHLLEGASRIKLAVRSAKPGEELFHTEGQLAETALQRGWLDYTFERN